MILNNNLALFRNDERFRNVSLSIEDFQDNPLKEWTDAQIILESQLDSDEGQWLVSPTVTVNRRGVVRVIFVRERR